MAYNSKNKLRMYAEDATDTASEINGIVYKDEDWDGVAERKRGAREGIARSQEYNTALRQSSLMATTLAEVLAKRYDTIISTDLSSTTFTNFESYIEYLSNRMNIDNFLLEGEVKKKHLNQDVLSGTFSSMTAGNVNTKINGKALTDIFESNGTTVKNSTNVTANINGKAITDIFENDGLTAKKSSSIIYTNTNHDVEITCIKSDGTESTLYFDF